MSGPIRFYGVSGAYGWCSNFAPSPIDLEGKRWPTVEHWFQAQKFAGTEHEQEIRAAVSPMIAARMGRSRVRPLRADWEQAKDLVMWRGLRAKFTQHPELAALLLETGDSQIVEHTENDCYWADGGDGSGQNRLGELLMRVRDELRAAEEHVAAWRSIMKPGRAWVAFLLGTCVVVTEEGVDPIEHAKTVLREHGPVRVGTPGGDFSVARMDDSFGWVVSFDHPDILTRVPLNQASGPSEMAAGIIGRSIRGEDARILGVVHVEPI